MICILVCVLKKLKLPCSFTKFYYISLHLEENTWKWAHFVAVLPRWSRRSSRSWQTHRSLNAISSSWALRSFLSLKYLFIIPCCQPCLICEMFLYVAEISIIWYSYRSAFLSSRAWRSLGARTSRQTCRSGWASRTTLTRRTLQHQRTAIRVTEQKISKTSKF